MKPFVRSQYNYDMNEASEQSGLKCEDKTLAQQQFKDETDINTIVERFGLTGEMPHVSHTPTYDDFTGVFDFQTAMNVVVQAQREFMSYPAKLRARFSNDPQEFLEFMDKPENMDEAIKLGLAERREPPAAPSTRPAEAPPASADAPPGAAAPAPK